MADKINIHYYCGESGCSYICDVKGLPRSDDGKFHIASYICPNSTHDHTVPLCIEIEEQNSVMEKFIYQLIDEMKEPFGSTLYRGIPICDLSHNELYILCTYLVEKLFKRGI